MYPVTISVHTGCWVASTAGSTSGVKLKEKQQPKTVLCPQSLLPSVTSVDANPIFSLYINEQKDQSAPDTACTCNKKYICTATQFCLYRSTGSAAQAGQGECVDTEGFPHRTLGNIQWNVELTTAQTMYTWCNNSTVHETQEINVI